MGGYANGETDIGREHLLAGTRVCVHVYPVGSTWPYGAYGDSCVCAPCVHHSGFLCVCYLIIRYIYVRCREQPAGAGALCAPALVGAPPGKGPTRQ